MLGIEYDGSDLTLLHQTSRCPNSVITSALPSPSASRNLSVTTKCWSCSQSMHLRSTHCPQAALNCSVLKMKGIMLMKAKSNEFYKTLNYKYQNIQTHVTQWIFFFTTCGGGNKHTDGNCPCPTPCRRAHSSVQHSRDKKSSVLWKQPTSLQKDWLISDPGSRAPILEEAKLMNIFFIPNSAACKAPGRAQQQQQTLPHYLFAGHSGEQLSTCSTLSMPTVFLERKSEACT